MTVRRIALAGGGTAGHVYPALAVAEAYQQLGEPVELVFLGSPDGFGARVVPARGYRFAPVPAAPLFGVGVAGKLQALYGLITGIVKARQLLEHNGTKLVIGFGGYASAGTLLAARSLRLRTALHEANAIAGLTNRMLGRLVDRIYLGFKTATGFPKHRTLVTGTPVPARIAAINTGARIAPAAARRPFRVLITGGSLGAPFLNQAVPHLVQRLTARGLAIEVTHQTGEFDPNPVRQQYVAAGISASVVPYIDDMAVAYAWADFAITRAGAATIAELAISGLPALLVPLPAAARDHQIANALAFAEEGGGWWIREVDWDAEGLAARIASLLTNAPAWAEMSRAVRRLATPDAASRLIVDCEAMMPGRW